MTKSTLIGKNLMDFIQQAPEKVGMTELPIGSFVEPTPGETVLIKASPATLTLALQFAAFGERVNRHGREVEARDSLAQQRECQKEFEYFAGPTNEALNTLLGVQMRLDLALAGVDYSKYPGVGLNANLEIVGYEGRQARISELLEAIGAFRDR